MRRETAGVTESLLESAKDEFLQYGFRDASMRRISAASGVSTNSIYTRFGDKAGLFRAIVQEAADGLMEIYLQSIGKAAEYQNVEQAIEEGNEPPIADRSIITPRDAYNESVMLGLRLERGIVPTDSLLEMSGKYIDGGFMKYKDGRLSFTTKGFLVSNTILSDIIDL